MRRKVNANSKRKVVERDGRGDEEGKVFWSRKRMSKITCFKWLLFSTPLFHPLIHLESWDVNCWRCCWCWWYVMMIQITFDRISKKRGKEANQTYPPVVLLFLFLLKLSLLKGTWKWKGENTEQETVKESLLQLRFLKESKSGQRGRERKRGESWSRWGNEKWGTQMLRIDEGESESNIEIIWLQTRKQIGKWIMYIYISKVKIDT